MLCFALFVFDYICIRKVIPTRVENLYLPSGSNSDLDIEYFFCINFYNVDRCIPQIKKDFSMKTSHMNFQEYTGTWWLFFRSILEKGGSSVDASIASMLCVGVHNAQSTGIGGSSFMLIYERYPEEYSTDEFSKHILFCLFIHETNSYICRSCQVFFVMT